MLSVYFRTIADLKTRIKGYELLFDVTPQIWLRDTFCSPTSMSMQGFETRNGDTLSFHGKMLVKHIGYKTITIVDDDTNAEIVLTFDPNNDTKIYCAEFEA